MMRAHGISGHCERRDSSEQGYEPCAASQASGFENLIACLATVAQACTPAGVATPQLRFIPSLKIGEKKWVSAIGRTQLEKWREVGVCNWPQLEKWGVKWGEKWVSAIGRSRKSGERRLSAIGRLPEKWGEKWVSAIGLSNAASLRVAPCRSRCVFGRVSRAL